MEKVQLCFTDVSSAPLTRNVVTNLKLVYFTLYHIVQHAAFIVITVSEGTWSKCSAGPRHVGAPDRQIIWRHFKPTFVKLFRFRAADDGNVRVRVQNADNFLRHSFALRNQSLPAPYFLLFQWGLGAPLGWQHRAVARLARLLPLSCQNVL